MVTVERNQPACYYTICQRTRKRNSEVAEVEISSSESILLLYKPVSRPRHQSWYFCNCEGLHIKGRLGRCCTKLASSLHHSVLFHWFTCGAWPSTGRAVVRASCICSAEISSEESGATFAKFCTSENSLYTVCKHEWTCMYVIYQPPVDYVICFSVHFRFVECSHTWLKV